MLDVIGAGATATCTTDWHQIWKASPEAARLDLGIDGIHQDGQSRPVASTGTHSEFASSWMKQLALLTRRGYVCTWRNPVYIYAKLSVCVAAGLLIGFTFFRTTNSLQGSQDKLFVRAFCVLFNREAMANVPWIVGFLDGGDQCPAIATIAEQVHRDPNRLRSPRAPCEDVHLDCVPRVRDSDRNPVEHARLIAGLFLLVLDYWLRVVSCWFFISFLLCCVPILLDYSWARRRVDLC